MKFITQKFLNPSLISTTLLLRHVTAYHISSHFLSATLYVFIPGMLPTIKSMCTWSMTCASPLQSNIAILKFIRAYCKVFSTNRTQILVSPEYILNIPLIFSKLKQLIILSKSPMILLQPNEKKRRPNLNILCLVTVTKCDPFYLWLRHYFPVYLYYCICSYIGWSTDPVYHMDNEVVFLYVLFIRFVRPSSNLLQDSRGGGWQDSNSRTSWWQPEAHTTLSEIHLAAALFNGTSYPGSWIQIS